MKHIALRRCSTVLSVTAAATVITVFLSSCQTMGNPANVQPVAAKAELPPAEAPIVKVGDKTVWRNEDGSEWSSEVIDADGEIISFQTSGECSWTAPAYGFGPSLEWSGCNGSTGTQKIKDREGNLFPLQVGSNERWKYHGKRQGGNRSWSGTRNCKVEGAVNVIVPAGNFDTYHVVCIDRRRHWEYHYSPELGTSVTWHTRPRGGGQSKPEYSELISFTPGE